MTTRRQGMQGAPASMLGLAHLPNLAQTHLENLRTIVGFPHGGTTDAFARFDHEHQGLRRMGQSQSRQSQHRQPCSGLHAAWPMTWKWRVVWWPPWSSRPTLKSPVRWLGLPAHCTDPAHAAAAGVVAVGPDQHGTHRRYGRALGQLVGKQLRKVGGHVA